MIFKDITILDENFEIKDNMYVVTERSCIKYRERNARGRFWKTV